MTDATADAGRPVTVRIAAASDLDRRAILDIADGARIELAGSLLASIDARRTAMLSALSDGRDVYGVNTGMGAQSGVRLTAGQQASHQNNLLQARAVGGPPWLPDRDTRALLAVRIRNFLIGDTGVSADLVLALTSLLHTGLTPAVPASGYGSAGEIIPLAHAFGPLIGIGSVKRGEVAVDAVDALRSAGLATIVLGAKEGIALLQGVPGTTAQALVLADRVRLFIDQSITVVAMSVAGALAPQDVYLPDMARGDDELRWVNTLLVDRLRGTAGGPRSLQAPVSFRVAGAVLAHLARAVSVLEAAVDRTLMAITDSPAFTGQEFRGTPGFHGLDLAAALDGVAVGLVHAAEVSAARTHRLLDTRTTGLTAQLAANPGPDTGLITVHKRSAGLVHQLRRHAQSSIVGSIETSFGQEDVQTFSWEAAANARAALGGAVDVLAGELLTAVQAVDLGAREIGPDLLSAMGSVRQVVDPIERDRPFGRDVDALREFLRDGGLTPTRARPPDA